MSSNLASSAGYQPFTLHVPTRIVFGIGSSNKVLQEAENISGRKIFLVTDIGIERAGIAEKVRKALGERFEVSTFNEVEPEPRIQIAESVSQAVRQDTYDIVVGVGGGSALDMAKVASVMATNSGTVADYAGGIFNIEVFKKKGLPMILLPTTAGTGSEVSPTSMVIARGMKVFLTGRWLMPDIAIVDPTLTLTMPPRVTAATGLDALAHSIEGMLSAEANLITDTLALKAVELIPGNLRRAYSQGSDLKARAAMSLAALLAGVVLYAKMVYGHSIAYTIATRYGLPHGVSVAIPLPYIMEYNLPAREEKLAQIAKAMGEGIDGLSTREAAYRAIFAVRSLIQEVGVPTTLREVGATRDILPSLAEECIAKYPRPNNPLPMSREDAIALYERIWNGRLGP